jgi:hypothetical protein
LLSAACHQSSQGTTNGGGGGGAGCDIGAILSALSVICPRLVVIRVRPTAAGRDGERLIRITAQLNSFRLQLRRLQRLLCL